MPIKILNILFFAIGVCLVIYGIQSLHFKITDTRLLPFWVPQYNSIFINLIYGIGLIILSYVSFKKSEITTDLIIVLLSFPVFSHISYFFNIGLIYWLVGVVILISNIAVLYKLITIIIFSLTFDFVGGLSYYFILMYSSMILLLVKIYFERESLANLTKYKMSQKNKLIFGILLIPLLVSKAILMI